MNLFALTVPPLGACVVAEEIRIAGSQVDVKTHPGRDRTGGGHCGGRAAGLGAGPCFGGAEAARFVDLARRRAPRLATSRSDLNEAPPQALEVKVAQEGILRV
jgi:hypothetical protein